MGAQLLWGLGLAAGWVCKETADCEYLGKCVAGKCVCGHGFKGESCGELDFTPASAATKGLLWPEAEFVDDNSTFSWGFSSIFDNSSGVYDAVVNVGCCYGKQTNQCGVTVAGTYLVHLQSTEPDRGFKATGVFIGPTSFNPHLMRAPNGTVILYFRVNDMSEYKLCQGDGTVVANSSTLRTYINRSGITHTDPSGDGPGANMYAAWAPSMDGPWQVAKVDISGMGLLHLSNPSATFLQDGRVLLAYRFNPHAGGEQNGIAVADSFLGPFRASWNITKGPHKGNDEDPFVWQAADKSCHILYHNDAYGYHDFTAGPDCTHEWVKSPTGSKAFTLDVEFDTMGTAHNGGDFAFARRERPELLFRNDDPSNGPAFLINGVNTKDSKLPFGEAGDNARGTGTHGFSHAFSFIQPLRGDVQLATT